MKEKVSVIIPIHNTEKQLPRCIDSLLKQRMKEIEIILVDDGSTDSCGEICDAYASKDERVKVFHTPYLGVAAARNLGIQKASCDYIMFVDSDDWVHVDFCEAPYQCAVENCADIVMFLLQRVKSYSFLGIKYEKYRSVRSNIAAGVKTREEAIDLIFGEVSGGSCNLLYKKSLFQGILFPVGHTYEDIGTIYKLVWKSARIYYLKRVLYYYYYRDGSITTLRSNPVKSDWRKMYLQRLADLSAWGYSAEKLEQYRLGCVMTYCIKFGWEEDRNDAHFIQWLRQCKEIPHCFTWKRKLLFVLLKFWPPLFNLVCTLWKKR